VAQAPVLHVLAEGVAAGAMFDWANKALPNNKKYIKMIALIFEEVLNLRISLCIELNFV
jgi:hypothetical protein